MGAIRAKAKKRASDRAFEVVDLRERVRSLEEQLAESCLEVERLTNENQELRKELSELRRKPITVPAMWTRQETK